MLLATAVREFARSKPWLDADLAVAFFERVVGALPGELFAYSPEYLTFGRHDRSGILSILLGNYLLAGVYRSNGGDVTLATPDGGAPGVRDAPFQSCPIPVYLSHFPLSQIETAAAWGAWENFTTACGHLQAAGTQARRYANGGREGKMPLLRFLDQERAHLVTAAGGRSPASAGRCSTAQDTCC